MNSSFYSALTIITDIGDSASLAAITAAGSVYLISRKAYRAAAFLLVTLLMSTSLISLLKLGFLGCEGFLHFPDVHSPSGHTALSAAVFWAFALLMRRQLDGSRRFLPLALLSALIATIAYSRVELHFHTAPEVWCGLAAGIVGFLLSYLLILKGKSNAPFDAYVLALWGVVAAFAVHGHRLPSESMIKSLASHIKSHVHFCNS